MWVEEVETLKNFVRFVQLKLILISSDKRAILTVSRLRYTRSIMSSLSVLVLSCHLLHPVISACTWTATDNTGAEVTLDLSCLNQESLSATDNANHDYEWSVCSNGIILK